MKPSLQTFGKIISLLLLAIFLLASCDAANSSRAISPSAVHQDKANVETIDVLPDGTYAVNVNGIPATFTLDVGNAP